MADDKHLRRGGFDFESDWLSIMVGDGQGALDELGQRPLGHG